MSTTGFGRLFLNTYISLPQLELLEKDLQESMKLWNFAELFRMLVEVSRTQVAHVNLPLRVTLRSGCGLTPATARGLELLQDMRRVVPTPIYDDQSVN